MAGAILALAAVFAVTITVSRPGIRSSARFCSRWDSACSICWASIWLTGVFVLAPLALLDKRPGVTLNGVLRNWGLVFVRQFRGCVDRSPCLMSIVFTYGFSIRPE